MVSDSAIGTKPHHRHHHHVVDLSNSSEPVDFEKKKGTDVEEQEEQQSGILKHERVPLIRNLSVGDDTTATSTSSISRRRSSVCQRAAMVQRRRMHILLVIVPFLAFFIHSFFISLSWYSKNRVIEIEDAEEFMIDVDIDRGIQLWYRIWGNRLDGIPVLFVHGGPGNAVEDYHDGNKRFFDPHHTFVVEIDQRGTGKSQPSVRDDWHNMEYYKDISIDVIASDFEIVRKHLDIDKWLVWGGSYGSTVGLNYAERYPSNCLALILRGIYLDTKKELNEVYTLDAFKHNKTRSSMFHLLHKIAAKDAKEAGEEPLDPNDSVRLLRIYERMITDGDRHAIWNWHTFENNLMEEDPKNLLDPHHIIKSDFPEAQSVAFFETRLWLRGSYEQPSELLERVDSLSPSSSSSSDYDDNNNDIPVWICQGLRDLVCPPKNAQLLVNALYEANVNVNAHFIQSGHEDTDPVMEKCLKRSMRDFLNSQR